MEQARGVRTPSSPAAGRGDDLGQGRAAASRSSPALSPADVPLFQGLFPPRAAGFDGRIRRVAILALLTTSAALALGALLVPQPGAVLGAAAAGLVGSLIAAAIPWHRLGRDAFAFVGIAATIWVGALVRATGGSSSLYPPLGFIAVGLCTVAVSRRLGTLLGILSAAAVGLPLAYEGRGASSGALVVPLFVLAAAGVFLPWLIAEAHRAIRAAAGADRDLVSERQVSGELRRAQNVREEYMSVLAHELRNPLIGIEAAARTLLDRSDAGAAEATAAGIAVETRHALDLIDGLTDVASLETGRMRLALRSIDLARLLRETATATDTRDHPVVLRGAEAPVQVHADEHRIGQVIRNLVANAARYSPAGTVVEVDLGLTRDRRSAVVKVRDSGPGIPPGERGRLFQKFARLSTAGATRGSGLGLYICKGIVDDHGGELSADWPPGGGSVFSFTLPVADP